MFGLLEGPHLSTEQRWSSVTVTFTLLVTLITQIVQMDSSRNLFHLQIMEATLLIGTVMLQLSFYTLP